MTLHRRAFLQSLLATGALAGAGRLSFAKQARRVSLGLLLDPETPEGRGATLGLDEAHRVGELLHVEITSGPTSEFALIGLEPPKQETKAVFLAATTPSSGLAWDVTSSPAFRQQALGRSKDRRDLHVADWHSGLMKFGAEELNVRFRRRFGQPMDERSWHGWVAVKCAVELALRYPGGDPRERIGDLRLDGHKGMMLSFDPQDRHLIQPVYVVDSQGNLVDQVEPE
ncbi:MAG TPA: hypothetical protein VGS07_30125 [Thermoanaerobaculia bacterium]|jgi:hypothetical protein|nr:hypothetical protein [Thermoanaerobaculia bacterium]